MFAKSTAIILIGSLSLLAGCAPDRSGNSDRLEGSTALFFREDWKEIPAEIPVSQRHVNNPQLVVTRWGPGENLIKKSHHDHIVNDPWYVWSGLCEGRWGLTLRKKGAAVNLSNGQIRLRTKQSGGHVLRVLLGLENGDWLVSSEIAGETADWHLFTADVATLQWNHLDMQTMEMGSPVDQPNLKRVGEIGWTDLRPGGASAACSRVDWIEIYGIEVKRS